MISSERYDFIIYTDGACLGNPGEGGWAGIIYNSKDNHKRIIVGSEQYTTNNRMELLAVIESLKAISFNTNVKIYSDSKYVLEGITKWIHNWKKNNWMSSNKKKIKNIDLWEELDDLVKRFNISWEWVKGHSDDKNNNEADELARLEAQNLLDRL
jgi:ribonuclease HI